VALLPQLSGTGAAQLHGAVTSTDGTWRGESPKPSTIPGRHAALAGVKGRGPPQGRSAAPADDRVTIDAQTIQLALVSPPDGRPAW
jgi:hypothetical protein